MGSEIDFQDEGAVAFVTGQGENEEDLVEFSPQFGASITSKDWTVETLVSQMRKGRIDLSPSFQRRNAWMGNRKSKLIESIVMGFPIPQIVLVEKQNARGQYFVLDGKQRLLAMRQFFAGDGNDLVEFDKLKLGGLEAHKELNGLTIEDMGSSHPEALGFLENQSIRTVVLSKWSSESMLLSLFLRLNTGSVPLSPQELRHALIPGEFLNWLDEVSGEMQVLHQLLNNPGPDRRMADAELLLRFMAFSASLVPYKGNLKEFLDQTSKIFTKEWSFHKNKVESLASDFEASVNFGMDYFGIHGFSRKWSVDKRSNKVVQERRLNRALFDVQAYSFSILEVRQELAEGSNCAHLADAFKDTCINDAEFAKSISNTTKTADAFYIRHSKWRDLVQKATGIKYDLPSSLSK